MKAELNWKFTENLATDTPAEERVRLISQELGIESICPAISAHIRTQVATLRTGAVLEIGTGVGLSALKILSGNPVVNLTTIEINPDFYRRAKTNLKYEEYLSSHIRFINSDALDVMPRLNRNSYDLVIIDGDPRQLVNYFEHALKLTVPGGGIIVPHALWQGKVADSSYRGEPEISFRSLIQEVSNSEVFISCLSPIGDGLLTVTKPAKI